MDGKVKRCEKCGDYLNTRTSYYEDARFKDGRFYICKPCIQFMVEQRTHKNAPTNETKDSVKKVCQMLDVPYLEDIYNSCVKNAQMENSERQKHSPFSTYIVQIKSLPQYKGMGWEHSVFPDDIKAVKEADPRIVNTFGEGFSPSDYQYLQQQFDDWCARTQVDSKSQEMYVVQICLQSLDIYKDRRLGKDVTNKLKALDTLMNAANLQPRQNVSNAASDSLSFSQLIQKWEEEEPIPEPSEEFKDVDGIGKYLRVWFSGHLAKALGLKNAYTDEYDEYIKHYTVTKPQVTEEGRSEDIYSTLFGQNGD